MPTTLSWNEIRSRALAFSKEWENESSEDAEAKSFWDAFFNVFGITRRRIASFEVPVKKSDGAGGFIDLLWKGKLLVEHKSRGKNLDRAAKQALDYFPGLKERDLPRYVVVSDFANFRLYDLDTGDEHEFPLKDFHKNIRLFGFIAGYQTRVYGEGDPVNIKAAEKLGKLHDLLKESGYEGHELEVLLVRLLFCLFAEDSTIFPVGLFQQLIEDRTKEDGSDLGAILAQLFQVLDTPENKRQKKLDESLAEFPYINGQLFRETLSIASFDAAMRDSLLDCAALDWSLISPAIFGSLFQSIMDKEARRNLGAHYTTEKNILKALNPLFLDELRAEFEAIKGKPKVLQAFHEKLSQIRILDPACGCGNFLTIAYRELRFLELEVLRVLYKKNLLHLDVDMMIRVNVDQFSGIEIEDYPAQIAQVSLWLTDHQMNQIISDVFGQYYARLPLKTAPHIVTGNALSIDWKTVVEPAKLSYIVGNPPFVGAKYMSEAQRAETAAIFRGVKNAGLLDYVCNWYRKATDYMQANPEIRTAFVSTNSITQGEQVAALWGDLMNRGVVIHYAHRTFQWESEARGKAAVHCVIVGFGLQDRQIHALYDYENVKGEPAARDVKRINPYLVDAPDVFLYNKSSPICAVPPIGIGNKPIDDGNYLFTPEEKKTFLKLEPSAEKWFRRWKGSVEFINNIERWCLWLGECPPNELKHMPEAMRRVAAVKKFRLGSDSKPTQKLAETPTRFHVEKIPKEDYLIVPKVSSEKRLYLPIGFEESETLASDLVFILENATVFHFGVLSSIMHMAWTRAVAGRLKSDYRYSAGIVYNHFPWPEPTDSQRQTIEDAAQGVLDVRAKYPDSSFADLYDPLTMPSDLLKAHQKLDRAVDQAYRKKAFSSEAERVAFLFERYQQLTSMV